MTRWHVLFSVKLVMRPLYRTVRLVDRLRKKKSRPTFRAFKGAESCCLSTGFSLSPKKHLIVGMYNEAREIRFNFHPTKRPFALLRSFARHCFGKICLRILMQWPGWGSDKDKSIDKTHSQCVYSVHCALFTHQQWWTSVAAAAALVLALCTG